MYVSKFRPDTAYGAEDISDIVKTLTGAGVSPSSPNDVLSAVAGGGVTVTDEKCAVRFADTTKTKVKIGAGTVIMPDGSFLVTSGEVLDLPTGETVYVSIHSDVLEQNVPTCSLTAPADSDVLLATVENGEILDSRIFSKSKISAYGSNKTASQTCTGAQVKAFSKKNGSTADDADRIFPLSAETAYTVLVLSMPKSEHGDRTVAVTLGESFSFVGMPQRSSMPLNSGMNVVLDNTLHRIYLSPLNSTQLQTALTALYS